jgi:hypothetical protein
MKTTLKFPISWICTLKKVG